MAFCVAHNTLTHVTHSGVLLLRRRRQWQNIECADEEVYEMELEINGQYKWMEFQEKREKVIIHDGHWAGKKHLIFSPLYSFGIQTALGAALGQVKFDLFSMWNCSRDIFVDGNWKKLQFDKRWFVRIMINTIQCSWTPPFPYQTLSNCKRGSKVACSNEINYIEPVDSHQFATLRVIFEVDQKVI